MPRYHFSLLSSLHHALCAAVVATSLVAAPALADGTLTLGRATLVDKGLVGVGRLPAALRDKFGETFGSASGMATDPTSWRRTADGYAGTIYLLPDRGYNLGGTTDYRLRINKLAVTLRPAASAAAGASLDLSLTDTLLLTDAEGQPLTALDPDGVRAPANGLPPLPQAANGRVSLDPEALVRLADGSFFISDEYGPYIYRFSAEGRMLSAIRPPEAFIPRRHGADSFASANPPAGTAAPVPRDPDSGRQNNQGFEGLAVSPDGRFLAAILQSAARQDSGPGFDARAYTRLLVYDIADPAAPRLLHEHVVTLPVYVTPEGGHRVAAQSEMLALDATRFLLLCRDGGAGYAQSHATSLFRRIMLVDLAGATDIAGSPYDGATAVAPNGALAAGVVPAKLTSFIDLNDNAVLGRFGLHNGEPNDAANLSEKWESMALVPVLDPQAPHDVFLFVGNDNDFITQDGFQAGASYRDPAGVDVDTRVLVYRLTIPPLD